MLISCSLPIIEKPRLVITVTTGDGLLSALHLLQVIVDTGKPLSELAKVMEVLPQALVNAKVPNDKKESYMEYSDIAEAIAELEKKFAGEGRVLIRPSGTEPLVRVMIEGKDQKVIDEEGRFGYVTKKFIQTFQAFNGSAQ